MNPLRVSSHRQEKQKPPCCSAIDRGHEPELVALVIEEDCTAVILHVPPIKAILHSVFSLIRPLPYPADLS